MNGKRHFEKQLNKLSKKEMSKENIDKIKELASRIICDFDELGIVLAKEDYIGSDINLAYNIMENFYKDFFGKDYYKKYSPR